MTRTTDDHLKANYGVALVTARLSAECLVRPVTTGTDVGVDLYCESVESGKPFLHFWVQVKAGSQCEVDEAGARACCRFERRHLEYWRRQPVPVFAALVPAEWPVEHEPDVHVLDVTSYLLDHALPEGDSVRLTSDRAWKVGDHGAIRSFLDRDVPEVSARRLCAMGLIGPVPTVTPEYVFRVPSVPVAQYSEVILSQIRRTAAFSIVLMATSDERDPELLRTLGEVLKAFPRDRHWETHAARACALNAERSHLEAVESVKAARSSIEGDSGIDRRREPWPTILLFLDRLEERCAGARPGTGL